MNSFIEIQDALEKIHPLPKDLVRLYVLGNTGVGKTSIIREIMGTTKLSFPSVGHKRTTTVPTEYILRKRTSFKLTVIFKTKEDILIAIDDVLESAIEILFNKENEPEETKRSSIKKSLEETPDQTVRFKFILPENNFDEIASIIISSIKIDNCADSDELLEQETVQRLIQQLREKMYGWIDNIVKQRCGKNLSDINYQCETTNKSEFIEKVKPLLSNDAGTISPILSYARIEGEILSEQLSNEQFILIDSEGIGHNLNALNTCHFGFFDFADYILLIEEAKQPFMTTREIIKDIFHKGYNNKLKIIFNKFDKDTSIDDIKKEIKNLKGKKNDSTGIKIDEKKCFFLTNIDDQSVLLDVISKLKINISRIPVEIQYDVNFDKINAIFKKSMTSFLSDWEEKIKCLHWKITHAFNRRMFNKEDQYYDLVPILDFCNFWFNQMAFSDIVKFDFKHTLKQREKDWYINQVKQSFFQHLLTYSRWLILEKHHGDWDASLQISGTGSKNRRATSIGEIFKSVASIVDSPELRKRAGNSLQAICADDPRIKTNVRKSVQIRINQYKIIKYAAIKLNTLTIIAGENDTGKSTVSKIFFNEIRKFILYKNSLSYPNLEFSPNYPVFIDTPDILDKFSYIKNTSLLLQQNGLHFDLPYWVTDLILRFSQPVSDEHSELYEQIKNIIQGEIRYSKSEDNIIYKKNSEIDNIPIFDTSTGIKMFGILQILIQNQTLKKGSVLILDEPEVHVHPNWQLKYAEIMVALVKQGVKILLSSHSPYLIEALVRYSRREEIDGIELYLTEKQDNQSIVQCVTQDIGKIFEKLSEPFDIFNQLDTEEVTHG